MPAGLNVLNDGNIVQIDDSYENFYVVDAGVVSGSPGDIQTVFYTGSGNKDSLVFIRPQGFGFGTYVGSLKDPNGYNTSGFDWISNPIPDGQRFRIRNYAGTCSWFAANRYGSSPASRETYGLEVFTATGALAFSSSSNLPPLRVRAIIRHNTFQNADYTIPAPTPGKKNYILLNPFRTTVYDLVESEPGIGYFLTDVYGTGVWFNSETSVHIDGGSFLGSINTRPPTFFNRDDSAYTYFLIAEF